jgi:MoxR-like ATPase
VGNSLDIETVADKAHRVIAEVETVIVGKREVVELGLVALLADGHILIEDIPGVGKTTLAKTLARALGCSFKRVQFTPDLLPADVTGTNIFNQKTSTFEFRQGPLFANVVLADEINRATPKTQSALLESMEEYQVTSDGTTYELSRPFFVIATENNVETTGTYPLPEAQLDRFLMRLKMGYPARDAETQILSRQTRTSHIEFIKAVVGREEILRMQSEVRDIYVEAALRDYIVDIVTATRNHPYVQLGASPRGSLALLHTAQARAALRNRTYVIPDDVKEMIVPVLAHRLIMRPDARVKSITAANVLEEIVKSVPAIAAA